MGDASASIEAARALWAESERELYPIAVSDVSRYQRMVMAVRALADEMRGIASIEELMTTWPRAGEMLVAVAAARGFPTASLPRGQIAGAAFALRDREIREQTHRQTQKDRIGAARESGEAWVLLDEAGRIDAGLIAPYRCTEMYLASGLAVVSLVQPDPTHGTASYVVTVIKLDPSTGELLDMDPGIEDWVEHARPADFLEHRAAVRDRISAKAV